MTTYEITSRTGKTYIIAKMRRAPNFSPLWWIADALGEISEAPQYGIDYFDTLAEAKASIR